MQRWLPAYGSGAFVVAAICLTTVCAFAFQTAPVGAFTVDGAPSSSTLDVQVAPQDLDLHIAILGLQVDAPRQSTVASKGPQIVSPAGPTFIPPTQKMRRQDSPKLSSSAKTKGATAEATDSPFAKWVPQQERADNSKPAAREKSQPKTDAETPELVARRPRFKKPRTQKSVDRPRQKSTEDDLAEVTDEPADQPSTHPEPKLAEEQIEDAQPIETAPQEPAEPEKPKFDTYNGKRPTEGSTSVRANLPPLNNSQMQLRTKVRRVLAHYYNRPLNTRDRSPWEMMHAMLAYEVHSKVLQGGPQGKPTTAVGWLCFNQDCKRRSLMYVNNDGELRVRVGPALQGHHGQLLAMLAQSKVSKDYPMLVDKQDFTVSDLIEMEKRTCYPRTELTFKLIGLSHYLPSGATWMNDQGMQWDIPKLVSEEIRQPVRGAACGGTHRLAGLTLAYKKRIQRGEPVDGEYLRAKHFVTKYQQYAYRLQNRDGSFSTEWFRGPGNKDDVDRKLKTTGHLLEWLLYAATDKELKHRKTTRAVNYLATIMYNNRYRDWESGPLGHAIHALLLYDRMMFAPYDKQAPPPVAGKSKRPDTSRRQR